MTLPIQAAFTATGTIDIEMVRNLLCCALEGGSNYWYQIDKVNFPPGLTMADYSGSGKAQDGRGYWHWSQLVPTHEGGSLVISSKEDDEINGSKTWVLDAQAIQKGLETMAKKYPKHFGDFIAKREDASTGDVFLQCCLFGECIYG